MKNCTDKEIKLKIRKLQKAKRQISSITESLFLENNEIYTLDFFIIAILKRTSTLITGFIQLIENKNYLCAINLVRLHLDSLLRLFAISLVENQEDFIVKIMQGEQINFMRDKNNKKISDNYLVNELSLHYPWVKNLYKTTSGLIHLSKTHLFQPFTKQNEFTIADTDENINNKYKAEAIEAMICITEYLFLNIDQWTQKKRTLKNNDVTR